MSSFSWIAYSDEERERTLDIISQFQERGTRDELGIGRIRDAFAGLLFPGTSTIQTRARYFLFIPWMFQELEDKRVGPEAIADRVERYENQLIRALLESEDTDGVIGKFAQSDLERYPRSIYWRGLYLWGIRLFDGSIEKYYNSLDSYYDLLDSQERTDTEDIVGGIEPNWDESIPDPPEDFPEQASLALRPEDARYLKQRVHEAIPESMLSTAHVVGELATRTSFPWEYPHLGELPTGLRESLRHARNFSEVIHGASLLYNLMLAQASSDPELIEEYTSSLDVWATNILGRQDELEAWDLNEFWAIVEDNSASRPWPMVRFVEDWIELALDSPERIPSNDHARALIEHRERQLKGGRARLQSQQALEAWGGDAGSSQLAYRWGIAQTHLIDIFDGLEGA